MARRLTEIYTREAFLAPFKFPRTKKFTDLKQMAGTGEDSMMDWENVNQYIIDPDEQLIGHSDSPSTDTFVTQSIQFCDRSNPKTEVQAIASGFSAAQSAEVSTSNVESCAAQAKRSATQSYDNWRAKDLTDSKGKEKRGRASNWSNDEKEAFLILKLEALEKSEKSWFRFVSEQLWRRCEIERADKSCQQQWDLLYKAYKAIGNLHDLNSQSEEHPVLFWDMDEKARMAMKKMWSEDLKYLPGTFPKKWYDLMEKIIVLQAQVKKTQDSKAIPLGELNRQPSTSTRANVWPSKCREEDNEQKYRENLHAREEHERRLQAFEEEYSKRLLAKEAEHSKRLEDIEVELLRRVEKVAQRLEDIEAELLRRVEEVAQRLEDIEAELLRRVEKVEQKHRKSLLDRLDEEELAASLKLTTIKERKRELA